MAPLSTGVTDTMRGPWVKNGSGAALLPMARSIRPNAIVDPARHERIESLKSRTRMVIHFSKESIKEECAHTRVRSDHLQTVVGGWLAGSVSGHTADTQIAHARTLHCLSRNIYVRLNCNAILKQSI